MVLNISCTSIDQQDQSVRTNLLFCEPDGVLICVDIVYSSYHSLIAFVDYWNFKKPHIVVTIMSVILDTKSKLNKLISHRFI